MPRPRPFGKSYSEVMSRPNKRMSGAMWERLFTTRKRTLMDKANKLERDAACFVTLTVKSPAGETWFYASSDELRIKLFKGGLIDSNSIHVTRNTLDQNVLLQGNIANPDNNMDIENIPSYLNTVPEPLNEQSIRITEGNMVRHAPTIIEHSNNVGISTPSVRTNIVKNKSSTTSIEKKSTQKTKKKLVNKESKKVTPKSKQSQMQTAPPHPFVLPQSTPSIRTTSTNFDEINKNIRKSLSNGNHTFFTDENLETELQNTMKIAAQVTPVQLSEHHSNEDSESSSETSSTSSSDSDSDDSSSSSSGDSSSSSDSSDDGESDSETPETLQTKTIITTVIKKEPVVEYTPPFPQNVTPVATSSKNNTSTSSKKEKRKTTNNVEKSSFTSQNSGNNDTIKNKVDSNNCIQSEKERDAASKKKKTAIVKGNVKAKISKYGDVSEVTTTVQNSSGKKKNLGVKINSETNEKSAIAKKTLKKGTLETKKKKSGLSSKEKVINKKNTNAKKRKNVTDSKNPDEQSDDQNISSLKDIKRENIQNSLETNPYHFTTNMTPKKSNPDRGSKNSNVKHTQQEDKITQNKNVTTEAFVSVSSQRSKSPHVKRSLEKDINTQNKNSSEKSFFIDRGPQVKPKCFDEGVHQGMQDNPRNVQNRGHSRSRSPWNKSPRENYNPSATRRKRCHSVSSDYRSSHFEKNDEFNCKRRRFEEPDPQFQNHHFRRNASIISDDRHGNEYWDVNHRKPWERRFDDERLNRSNYVRNKANYTNWEADILAGWNGEHEFLHRTNIFEIERALPKNSQNFHNYGQHNKNIPRSRRDSGNIQQPRHEDGTMPRQWHEDVSAPQSWHENHNMPRPWHGDRSQPRHGIENRPQPVDKNAPPPLMSEPKWNSRYVANGNALLPIPQEKAIPKIRNNNKKTEKGPQNQKQSFLTSSRQQVSKSDRLGNGKSRKNIPITKQPTKKQSDDNKVTKNTSKHTFFIDTEGTNTGKQASDESNLNKRSPKKSPMVNYRRKFRTSNQDKRLRRKSGPSKLIAQVKPFNQETNKHFYNNKTRR